MPKSIEFSKQMQTMQIEFVKPMQYFINQNARYKVAYGGRGSGKSHTIARILLVKALQKPLRILNVRHIQKSIRESVYQLYCDLIYSYQLEGFFNITRDYIKSYNGSYFIFKGIQNELAQSIKSLEGVDICWVEEAQILTEASWDLLIPTIRKSNSEIWISFNPYKIDDFVYKKFVLNSPKNSIVKKINYYDNPWFPDVLWQEMVWDKEHSYQRYCHIWEGALKSDNDDAPFTHIKVAKFETQEGMSCFIDPSYNGSDKTGITFGYWHDGKPYVWVYEVEGNFSQSYQKILTRLEAQGVVTVTLESNGDQAILAMLIKQWLTESGLYLIIYSQHSSQNKLKKIWQTVGALESILTIHIASDYNAVLKWHEQAKHDDAIDSLAMWANLKH